MRLLAPSGCPLPLEISLSNDRTAHSCYYCRTRHEAAGTIRLLPLGISLSNDQTAVVAVETVVIELAAAALGVEDTATVAAATPKLTFRHYRREAAFDLLLTAQGAVT